MKLARPDVRHARIVLAGCPRLTEGDGDDAGLVAALRKRGLHARWMSWDDPHTLRADLVILRGAGDYANRLDEFLAWTRGVQNLLNAPDVVAWNVDKGYLRDLDRAGVPTLPDRSAAPGETGLVFLGGVQSHAFTTGPDRPQLAEADFEVWDLGYAALRAAADHLGIPAGELLYARVDVAGGAGDPRLRALNLVEPSLGWLQLGPATRDLQQREFALCVESALDRLGLGPFSQRRP